MRTIRCDQYIPIAVHYHAKTKQKKIQRRVRHSYMMLFIMLVCLWYNASHSATSQLIIYPLLLSHDHLTLKHKLMSSGQHSLNSLSSRHLFSFLYLIIYLCYFTVFYAIKASIQAESTASSILKFPLHFRPLH